MDRNPDWSGLIPLARESLSARRAWIEIDITCAFGKGMFGRSPQGERG